MRIPALVVLAMTSAISLPGCGIKQRAIMPGRDPDQVWNAMVAVAQTPDYASSPDPAMRWTVRENDVLIDANASRIEVHRRLEREIHQPLQQPQHETREWKFGITLEQRDPPTIVFETRNSGVPAHAWHEADRYFNEVQQFLGPPASAPAAASSSPPGAN
jgi:hypothetical protein